MIGSLVGLPNPEKYAKLNAREKEDVLVYIRSGMYTCRERGYVPVAVTVHPDSREYYEKCFREFIASLDIVEVSSLLEISSKVPRNHIWLCKDNRVWSEARYA